jgi:hypothetical protein
MLSKAFNFWTLNTNQSGLWSQAYMNYLLLKIEFLALKFLTYGLNKFTYLHIFSNSEQFSWWTAVIQMLILMSWGRIQLRKMIGPFCWKQGLQDHHQQNSMHHLSNWIWFGNFLWYPMSRFSLKVFTYIFLRTLPSYLFCLGSWPWMILSC